MVRLEARTYRTELEMDKRFNSTMVRLEENT